MAYVWNRQPTLLIGPTLQALSWAAVQVLINQPLIDASLLQPQPGGDGRWYLFASNRNQKYVRVLGNVALCSNASVVLMLQRCLATWHTSHTPSRSSMCPLIYRVALLSS
eukprot:scaffold8152_cov21-Tisochrysis_lutea.AAC.3